MFSLSGFGYDERLADELFNRRTGFRYSSYMLRYRSVEDFPMLEEIGIGSTNGTYGNEDFDLPGGFGMVVCKAIPAGAYEIYGYSLLQVNLPNDTRWEAFLDEPVRFEIEAGTITYLGEFVTRNRFREEAGGKVVPDGVIFDFQDSLGRDRLAANLKWPYLMATPLQKQLVGDRIERFNGVLREYGGVKSFF